MTVEDQIYAAFAGLEIVPGYFCEEHESQLFLESNIYRLFCTKCGNKKEPSFVISRDSFLAEGRPLTELSATALKFLLAKARTRKNELRLHTF